MILKFKKNPRQSQRLQFVDVKRYFKCYSVSFYGVMLHYYFRLGRRFGTIKTFKPAAIVCNCFKSAESDVQLLSFVDEVQCVSPWSFFLIYIRPLQTKEPGCNSYNCLNIPYNTPNPAGTCVFLTDLNGSVGDFFLSFHIIKKDIER